MGLFDSAETVEEMPKEGAIRGLTGEMVEEANRAIQDGKVRAIPANSETDKAVKTIKRYLSREGWGCKVKTVGGKIYWQVVEKKTISDEHKAKMLAALDTARKAKEATKAVGTTAPAASNGNGNGNSKPKAAASAK